ncbi:MAG: hypothetical protein MUF84_07350 [Anaerolineae bacterium]|nr:hypothetical protein [Anaerolineae bacterium]
MRTGVSYMGHHDPTHLEVDLAEMQRLGLDDVLVAAQENDFTYFTGKIDYTPRIAKDHGLRPISIFWGALNLFGGGRSSQFLLDHPAGFQVARDGSHRAAGCYMNPLCRSRIKEMVDVIVDRGFEGYFVDEPTPLRECYCASCRSTYEDWHGASLLSATDAEREGFRQRCVIDYVQEIATYCKRIAPHLETICCLMPHDEAMWRQASAIGALDNLGTDLYWVNNDREASEMAPQIRTLDRLCRQSAKVHHEWLQCWNVRRGREHRVIEQGRVLVQEKPDALYVWAWKGQTGTTETCDDPATSWAAALQTLELVREA